MREIVVRKSKLLNLCLTTAALGALLSPAMAMASDAPADQEQNQAAEEKAGTGFGEIVVTANKRDESLQDVGISVSAYSGRATERAGHFRHHANHAARFPRCNSTHGRPM